MAIPVPFVIHAEDRSRSPLGKTMNEIRTWLDDEKIQPTEFKTIVTQAGLGFEISFKSEWEADRFQRRFAGLVEDRAEVSAPWSHGPSAVGIGCATNCDAVARTGLSGTGLRTPDLPPRSARHTIHSTSQLS
jgi:hypothetical protein